MTSVFQFSTATKNREVKGEDVIVVKNFAGSDGQPCLVVALCDGHFGRNAADLSARAFVDRISTDLLAADSGSPENAAGLRHAIAEICRSLNDELAAKQDRSGVLRQLTCALSKTPMTAQPTGHPHQRHRPCFRVCGFVQLPLRCLFALAGATLTCILLIGRLLTVGSVGDSACVLDNGVSFVVATATHRISSNQEENARLRGAGCLVAPLGSHLQGPAKEGQMAVGPLRVWPGGLAVSRSLGDSDAGPHILAAPHVKQYSLPQCGCRLIAASDGLWDEVKIKDVLRISRRRCAESTAIALLAECQGSDGEISDDVTVFVADVFPAGETFQTLQRKLTGHESGKGKPRKPATGANTAGQTGSVGLLAACFGRAPNRTPGVHELSGVDRRHSSEAHSTAGGDASEQFPALLADKDAYLEFSELFQVHDPPLPGYATSLEEAAATGEQLLDITVHGRAAPTVFGTPELSVHGQAAPADVVQDDGEELVAAYSDPGPLADSKVVHDLAAEQASMEVTSAETRGVDCKSQPSPAFPTRFSV